LRTRVVFAKGTFPAEMETKPNEVLDELPTAGSKYKEISEIRPAYIDDNVPEVPDTPFEFPPHDRDEKARVNFPAYLLTARKAG
jgi:hypothetical protein